MKKTLLWLAVTAFLMLALPGLTVALVRSDAAMAVCFLLFFAVYPVWSILTGLTAGKNAKRLWFMPLVPAVLFLAGAWLFFDRRETAFLLYGSLYLALGMTAMLISALLRKGKHR